MVMDFSIKQDKLEALLTYIGLYKTLVLFSFLDIATTLFGVYLGHSESMPFTRYFIDHFGFCGIFMSKGIILLYLFPTLWGIYDLHPAIGKGTIYLCCFYMVFVAFHNIIVILKGV